MVYSPRPFEAQSQASSVPALAGGDFDAVGDHEGGVEADAELADHGRAFLSAVASFEGAVKARVPERAMVPRLLRQFLARHADALVLDGEGVGLLVGHDAHAGVFWLAEGGVAEASKRRRSVASAALATSSRRKISRSE